MILCVYDFDKLLRTSALMAGTCAITSSSSSVPSNDRSSQWHYISAKTDTPCSAVSRRQLSYLPTLLWYRPDQSFTCVGWIISIFITCYVFIVTSVFRYLCVCIKIHFLLWLMTSLDHKWIWGGSSPTFAVFSGRCNIWISAIRPTWFLIYTLLPLIGNYPVCEKNVVWCVRKMFAQSLGRSKWTDPVCLCPWLQNLTVYCVRCVNCVNCMSVKLAVFERSVQSLSKRLVKRDSCSYSCLFALSLLNYKRSFTRPLPGYITHTIDYRSTHTCRGL